MRILCMHKASPGEMAPPPRTLIEEMGKLIGEAAKSGILLGGDGLKPIPTRHRLTFAKGRCDVAQATHPGHNELPQRMVVFKARSEREALDQARRFGEAVGAAELELGPLTEAWDLGICPKPADAPLRYMILQLATPESEAGKPPTAAQQQGLRTVLAEMQKAGVLLLHEALLPSSKAVRLSYRDNVRTRIDGPFTESKELIGGFCMLQMRSFDEMIVWTERFVRILGGTVEIDLRVAADGDGSKP
jgi:hypothetical protein